jgi:hypothetical protein
LWIESVRGNERFVFLAHTKSKFLGLEQRQTGQNFFETEAFFKRLNHRDQTSHLNNQSDTF